MKPAVLLAMLLFVLSAFAQQPGSLEALLQLKPGNYWIYRGTALQDKTKLPVTWKTEILEESKRDDLDAFLVRGAFLDLAWFDRSKKPGNYLWIVYRNRFYILEATDELLQSFHDPKQPLSARLESEQPLIELPLAVSRCATAIKSQEPKRDDLFYCWYFEQKTRRPLNVKGVASKTVEVWELWYRTAPDHQILDLAPGIGFTAYEFEHHGTPSEAHVKLVEAHLN